MIDPQRIVRATAPPTMANLAVGFDLLGLAVKGEGDVVTARFDGEGEGLLRIDEIRGDGGRLSTEVAMNTCSAGVLQMLEDLREKSPDFSRQVVLTLDKRMPLGSGMGSSASSAAASVMAVNELLGRPFSKEELVRYALIGESVASGAIHGDNVVPSLLGGLVLMRANAPADVIRLPFMEDLLILLMHPHVEVMTEASRSRLAAQVTMSDYIAQAADLAAFTHAMHSGDKHLLRRCMNDRIIAPQRKQDIPCYDAAREAVMALGGINYDISGSGPSTFAFFEKATQALEAGEAVEKFLGQQGLACDVLVTRVDIHGARLLD